METDTNKVSKSHDIEFVLPQATGLQNVSEKDANLRVRTEFAFLLLRDGTQLEIYCSTKGNFRTGELTFLVAKIPRTVSIADLCSYQSTNSARHRATYMQATRLAQAESCHHQW